MSGRKIGIRFQRVELDAEDALNSGGPVIAGAVRPNLLRARGTRTPV